MTTDPFTDAAMEHLATVDHDKSREWFDGFVACTRWARDHLAAREADGGHGPRTTAAIREWTGAWPAAQEPTDDEVPESVANLIRDLTDPDDCWFDHHGGCQAHGYLALTPEQECPHSEAKRLLAARAARRDEERR